MPGVSAEQIQLCEGAGFEGGVALAQFRAVQRREQGLGVHQRGKGRALKPARLSDPAILADHNKFPKQGVLNRGFVPAKAVTLRVDMTEAVGHESELTRVWRNVNPVGVIYGIFGDLDRGLRGVKPSDFVIETWDGRGALHGKGRGTYPVIIPCVHGIVRSD